MQMTPPSAHTVKSFDEDLRTLRSLIGQMGGLARSQLDGAVEALIARDGEAARSIVEADKKLDRLEAEAEAFAISVIARRAPLASDLREVIAALKIGGVIERIGDYSKNIAKRATSMAQDPAIKSTAGIGRMGGMVSRMVDDALDAFARRDADIAESVCRLDEQVDDYYNSFFRSLLAFINDNPHHVTAATHLMFVAKNLERIGDHATNIAEMVYYSATGEYMSARSKADETAYMAGDEGLSSE